jgi:undecaprenyl phosphate N,N'-diacetylbacillosamine 1-phosphate transferase
LEETMTDTLWRFINYDWYRSHGKRLIDVAVSISALIVFCPLIFVVALSTRVVIGSPILFSQERPGLKERVFRMFKFRSMIDARYPDGSLMPDNMRLTNLGSFLRATSLDELPELWNVIKGDMSLIGPRPLLVEYLPHYSPDQRRRHAVRPGMTGLAQINGRNQTTWTERLDWDLKYVDRYSLCLDCKILAHTFLVLFRSDGGMASISALGKFTGCESRRNAATDPDAQGS